jgi:hypothetical protein
MDKHVPVAVIAVNLKVASALIPTSAPIKACGHELVPMAILKSGQALFGDRTRDSI